MGAHLCTPDGEGHVTPPAVPDLLAKQVRVPIFLMPLADNFTGGLAVTYDDAAIDAADEIKPRFDGKGWVGIFEDLESEIRAVLARLFACD